MEDKKPEKIKFDMNEGVELDIELTTPSLPEVPEGFKSGFVTLIGRPNVGKSTLLNAIMGEKISIISSIPQTTRYITRGIWTTDKLQAVFVDTPGMHLTKHHLAGQLNRMAVDSMDDVDVILYVVDAKRKPYEEEERVMDMLVKQQIPVVMVINKTDRSKRCAGDYIAMWNKKIEEKAKDGDGYNPLKYFIPISALKGDNLKEVKEALLELLPEAPLVYDMDTLTDFPLEFRIADLIREKMCHLLKDEVPHHTAVSIEEIRKEKNGTLVVYANIIMAAESQKGIVIGKGGEMIKEIGKRARKDINKVMGRKIHLELKVQVVKDWQNKPRIIRELGYGV